MAYIGNSPEFIQQARTAEYEFTATAGQTTFSGVDDNGLTLDLLNANQNEVYLNGSRLVSDDDFTVSGDTLTLTSGAALNDIIVIKTQSEVLNAGSYTKAESDSRYVNYTGDIINGNLQITGSVATTQNITSETGVYANTFGAYNTQNITIESGLNLESDLTLGNDSVASAINVLGDVLDINIDSNLNSGGSPNAQIKISGTSRLGISGTGITVKGDVVADGLTVDSAGADINLSGGRTVVTTDSPTGNGLVINGIGTPANYYFDIRDDNVRGILTVDSSGRMGIGTASPDFKLDVVGSTNYETVKLHYTETANTIQRVGLAARNYENNDTIGIIALYDDGSDSVVNIGGSFNAPNKIEFRTGSASAVQMHLSPDGFLGIGNDNPSAKLHVQHDNTWVAQFTRTAGTPHLKFENTSDNGNYSFVWSEYGSGFKWGQRQSDGSNEAVYLSSDSGGNLSTGGSTFNQNGVNVHMHQFNLPSSSTDQRRVRVTLGNYESCYVRIIAQRTNGGNAIAYWEGLINNNNSANYVNQFHSISSNPTFTFDYTTTSVFQWTFNASLSPGDGTIYVQDVRGGASITFLIA